MLEAARSQGLAYIGRFDLSKAMKVAYDAHPEWFVKNRSSGPREYAGTYQVCPNGGWAQEYSFEILREGLTRYDADGLFFNMAAHRPALHRLKLGVLPQVAGQARALVGGQTIKASRKDADGRRWFDLPPVHGFEAVQFADAKASMIRST